MPISPNEIKDRALKFSHEWENEKGERAEAQTFWNDFFNVFGIQRRRLATFEEPVKRARGKFEAAGGKGGFIDLLWRGVLIAEHKSRGLDLDSAYEQALGYFDGLGESDLPRYVIVSDFARFRIYDLDVDKQVEFPLKDLYKHIRQLSFISGYTPQAIDAQDPVNIKAAEKMGNLHDQLKASGYVGHDLEVLLVRLLFCVFADDTTIFEPKGAFREFLRSNTREDGSDVGARLAELFDVLNTQEDQRQKNLDERLGQFPYVNGKLFAERIRTPSFDSVMREALLSCCSLDWGRISPAIFGALFQSVMDEELRRNIGAHYTSEANILKVIRPLFLDDLREKFEIAKHSEKKLLELHKTISTLKFFDPACGCGNFLVVAYRELRKLELDILRAVRDSGQLHLNVLQLIQVNVDQFFGIEIEEFPAQIAQVALWLVDHQMNMQVSEEFGNYFRRLPLIHAASIKNGNALSIDWEQVIPAEKVDFIFGNPPFVGAKILNDAQRKEMDAVCGDLEGAGLLDYVAAWYLKVAQYLRGDQAMQLSLGTLPQIRSTPNNRVKIAFVSTNSITQGEQVGILWGEMLRLGAKIHFAHRTFQWTNEARGIAAVHCVIIGFAFYDTSRKLLYDYHEIKGDPHVVVVKNINPYLVDADDYLISRREMPLCNVPPMGIGNKPIDGGNYLFTDEEMKKFVDEEPAAAKYFRPWLGADEFLNGYRRWCLWLGGCPPDELMRMPKVMERIEAVRDFRLTSKSAPTRKIANTPTRFHVENMPESNYLVVPEVSSERRSYIPIGFVTPDVISSNLLKIVRDASLYHFGVLSSAMHMAWVRYVAGRMKSDYRYSSSLVYNNFPWPKDGTKEQIAAVESRAQAVLAARAEFPKATLAQIYDPLAMPPVLRKAHIGLDRAVDRMYGKGEYSSDAERVKFLFVMHQRYLNPAPAKKEPKRKSQT